eukprot:356953-Chlamydomonas_euryale.AAC.5
MTLQRFPASGSPRASSPLVARRPPGAAATTSARPTAAHRPQPSPQRRCSPFWRTRRMQLAGEKRASAAVEARTWPGGGSGVRSGSAAQRVQQVVQQTPGRSSTRCTPACEQNSHLFCARSRGVGACMRLQGVTAPIQALPRRRPTPLSEPLAGSRRIHSSLGGRSARGAACDAAAACSTSTPATSAAAWRRRAAGAAPALAAAPGTARPSTSMRCIAGHARAHAPQRRVLHEAWRPCGCVDRGSRTYVTVVANAASQAGTYGRPAYEEPEVGKQ